jgi:hypothetical protein
MTIYSADLQPVHPVSYLWALPALPALAAAVLALGGRALEQRFGRAAVTRVLTVALGAAAGVLLAASVGVLVPLPAGARLLVDAGAAFVDAGPVTVSPTLVLDPLRAALALAVTFAGLRVAAVQLDRAAGGRFLRSAVALAACAAAALLTVLADDAVLALIAWEALAWVAFVLVSRAAEGTLDAVDGRRVAQALTVNRLGQAAWLGAVALLLWGMAGGPSRVTADVRGVPGAGMELKTLGDRPPEASVRELAVGPTVSPRAIALELSLRDSSERRPFEEALLARRAGPLPLVLAACLALLLAAAGLGAAALLAWAFAPGGSRERAPLGLLVATAASAAAVSLLARFWFLFALAPAAAAAAAAVAALAVVAGVAAVVRRQAAVAPALRRLFRSLGVLPAADFARAAAWLDRLLGPASGVLAVGALVLVVALLVRR